MTPAQLAALSSLPEFPAFARELIRVAGITAAAALIDAWGGQEWRVPAVAGGGSPRGERRWGQLVGVVGVAAAERIVGAWPGEYIFIPFCTAAKGRALEGAIKTEYDDLTMNKGFSHRDAVFHLGTKYRKNHRSVEKIVNRPDVEEKNRQGLLFPNCDI
jgi:hypothetical protein